MKFVKSNLAKKLIIVLIALLLVNVAMPKEVNAVDFGGILLQPIMWLVLGIVVPVDMLLGGVLSLGSDLSVTGISGLADRFFGNSLVRDDESVLKKILIGPDSIFSGDITMLNANIFGRATDTSLLGSVVSIIAQFYVILRNIAAVIMLAGLIFTGIRILLSSNIPTKKTQYLMLLQDWIIGMALLIFSHIIMILVFEMSDAITKALGETLNVGRKYEMGSGL